jgi:hypothetical protein
MSKLLSLLGIKKDDDQNIPEMILHKNDPKPYYDKELKTWMIPGEEEEIKKNLLAQKKPPPIGKSSKKETKEEEEEINNNLVNPRKPKAPLKKQTNNPKNRYANVLPDNVVEKIENIEEKNYVNKIEEKAYEIDLIKPTKDNENSNQNENEINITDKVKNNINNKHTINPNFDYS